MAKKIIKSTQHPALKYVLKGASKDASRPILHQAVNVKEEYFCAASGFVAHFAEGRLEDEYGNIDEGTYKVDKQLLAESIEGTYPDLCALLPTHSPVFSITVNPTFLRDAMPDTGNYTNGVVLEFFGEKDPFLVRGEMKDGTNILALVMPMHRNVGYEGLDPCGVFSKRKPGHLRTGYSGVSWQYGVNDTHEYWEVMDMSFRPEAKWVVQRNFGEDTWNAYLLKDNSTRCLTVSVKDDDGKLVAENHEFRDIDLRDVRAVMAAVARYGKERRYV